MHQIKTHRRDRYQRGSLKTEPRSNGPDVWVYRWREIAKDGQTVKRKRIIGTKKEYSTETAAWKADKREAQGRITALFGLQTGAENIAVPA